MSKRKIALSTPPGLGGPSEEEIKALLVASWLAEIDDEDVAIANARVKFCAELASREGKP